MKTKAPASDPTSREKLILSAEHLFAERGFDGVSVRDISNDAGVNSALVGYYFRGKEGLLAEVYTRHCTPLKQERAALLAKFSENGSPTLEQILEAFIRPSLHPGPGSESHKSFSRLRAILSAENSTLLEKVVAENFDETSAFFITALSKVLPQLNLEDIYWRFHYLLGGIYYTALGPHRIRVLSKGKCDPGDREEATLQLIGFAAAGFNASPRLPKTSRKRSRRSPSSNNYLTSTPLVHYTNV